MKTIRLIAASAIFAAIFAISAFAQTGDKIGLVAWDAFGDPVKGIKKYSAALAALDKEMAPLSAELNTMGTSYQTKQKEFATLQEQMQKKVVPVNEATLQAKADEISQLERDIKKKQADAEARYKSRSSSLIGPISNDIIKALNEYAAAKGYAVIFDGGKLEESGILLGFAPKANVTDDFITFYNARPATTALVTQP